MGKGVDSKNTTMVFHPASKDERGEIVGDAQKGTRSERISNVRRTRQIPNVRRSKGESGEGCG